MRKRIGSVWLVVGIFLISCAGPQPGPSQSSAPSPQDSPGRTAPKRIALVLQAELTVLSETARQGGPSGSAVIQELLNAGPALVDDQGVLHPQLAETVPTT